VPPSKIIASASSRSHVPQRPNSTTHQRCDDGNSSNGSTDEEIPWMPGQQVTIAALVSSFPDGTGYDDIRYLY
jgi:hypothetical protein